MNLKAESFQTKLDFFGFFLQILALGEECDNCQLSLLHASCALSSGTNLINVLIK